MKNNRYSIKDLENLTNIKAHTIRIWEQRYGLLHPKRTSTNIRYYEDNDLRKLLNINLLYSNGLKISKIAALSEDEIIEQSKDVIQDHSESDNSAELLMISIVNLEETKVRSLLNQLYKDYGMEQMYAETIIPLLRKIGELWQLKTISVGHEHFFSNIYRAFVLSRTEMLTPSKLKNKKVLFFLPPNEEHELSMLVYQYLFSKEGWDVIYLGACVPYEDLEITYKQAKPDLVVTSFIKQISEKDFANSIQKIEAIIAGKDLAFAGHICQTYQSILPNKSVLIASRSDFSKIIV